MSKFVKIVVSVPVKHADTIRRVAGNAGAGRQGHYDFTSGSVKQIGRFRPRAGSQPAIGTLGKIERVAEERIEFLCERKLYKRVVAEIRKHHPYEQPAIEVYPLVYP